MTIIEELQFLRELLYLQKLIFTELAKKFAKFHYHGQKNLLWTLSASSPVHTFATCPPKNFNTVNP